MRAGEKEEIVSIGKEREVISITFKWIPGAPSSITVHNHNQTTVPSKSMYASNHSNDPVIKPNEIISGDCNLPIRAKTSSDATKPKKQTNNGVDDLTGCAQ